MFIEALRQRKNQYAAKLNELAYERLNLQKRIDGIDKQIHQLEGAQIENEQALKDASTQEAIDKSKMEVK